MLDTGPTLGEGHQRWQMNEINALIWPNDDGIGIMNEEDYDTHGEIAQDYGIVKKIRVTAPTRPSTPRRPSRRSRTRAST